jgi:hypothetical protein
MTRAVTLAEIADTNTFVVDGTNQRVGIASANPTSTLTVGGGVTVAGVVTATSFVGDGSGLTGIANTAIINADQINVTGVVTATSFVGSGANLTGVSGFATALSTDQTSPLITVFKTSKTLNVGAGISATVESDVNCGNLAFMRENIIHVAVGATFHIKTDTTLVPNVLGLF